MTASSFPPGIRPPSLGLPASALALLASTALHFGSAEESASGHWPQFRGPEGAGLSEARLPLTWSDTENLAWKTELPGRGSSSPVVWGEAVFVSSYRGEADSVVRQLSRLDLGSGAILWTREIGTDFPEDPAEGYLLEHGWSSSTPVTDGETVYAFFGKAGVHAFDFEGELRWSARTGGMSSRLAWGSASSPVLHEGVLVVPAGDELRALLGLDARDGRELWRHEADKLEQTYGSPILVKVDEGRTDLVFPAVGEALGLDPASGALRWSARYDLPNNMSNTPHRSGEFLTISGGFPRTARVALRVGEEGDATERVLYDTLKPATYMTPPVEHEGVLYWVSDNGFAFATLPGEAEELWMERIPDLVSPEGLGRPFYASPVLAGGRLYATSRNNGFFVIDPDPEGLRILARNRFESDPTEFNASPAVAGGKLLLRSQTHLYAVGE